MSILYDKSLEKTKYFERQIDFEKRLSCYSFRTKSFTEPVKMNKNFLITGFGGVPLSGYGDEEKRECVYADPFDSHTLIIGSTGSKKSRLVAMPTVRMLCASKESMIICDPKAEIFERTANYLKENNYKLYILNLRSPNKGDCWNPYEIAYDYYRNGDINRAYEFVNDIANNLALMESSKMLDPFWDNSFASLFLGLSILLFKICNDFDYPPTAVNIGNLIDLRKHMFENIEYNALQKHSLWDYIDSDNLIETALMGIKSAADQTRQSILATFDQKMRIFMTQPDLVKMLSDNTIKYDDIINDERPAAIFLLLPDEKTSFHGLVSLFVKQSYEYIITKLQEQSSKNLTQRVNYILDEFSSLPTIKDFPAMITAARSRNIRFNIFIQSKHQLILRYTDDSHTILSNCNNWIFLTSRELAMLEDISKLGGEIYETIHQPVLSIAELQRLDKDAGEALIFSGRLKPYVTRLPDIEKYDEGRFIKAELEKRELPEICDIDFYQIYEAEKSRPDIEIDTNLIAENQVDAIKKIQDATAEGIKRINLSAPSAQALTLESMKTFAKVADGKATKIIVPKNLQDMAGITTTFREFMNESNIPFNEPLKEACDEDNNIDSNSKKGEDKNGI